MEELDRRLSARKVRLGLSEARVLHQKQAMRAERIVMQDLYCARVHQVEKSERRLSVRKVRLGLSEAWVLRQEHALQEERAMLTAQHTEMADQSADSKEGQSPSSMLGLNPTNTMRFAHKLESMRSSLDGDHQTGYTLIDSILADFDRLRLFSQECLSNQQQSQVQVHPIALL